MATKFGIDYSSAKLATNEWQVTAGEYTANLRVAMSDGHRIVRYRVSRNGAPVYSGDARTTGQALDDALYAIAHAND